MTDYLTVSEILSIHEDQIARYGGQSGVRDMSLLEAAVLRPQSGYYDDVIAEAAALWESLSQNHPFLDGNKRAAFAATHVFLTINHVRLIPPADAIFAFIDGLHANNAFRFEALVDWLGRNTESID